MCSCAPQIALVSSNHMNVLSKRKISSQGRRSLGTVWDRYMYGAHINSSYLPGRKLTLTGRDAGPSLASGRPKVANTVVRGEGTWYITSRLSRLV